MTSSRFIVNEFFYHTLFILYKLPLILLFANLLKCVESIVRLPHLARSMATHGSVSAFDPSKEDWSSYVLRLKYYFDANGVTEASKKKSILTACGPTTFRRIGSLLTVARLEEISYNDLITEVTAFYDPKSVQRFQFNTRVRTKGESIATYVTALWKLAEHCNYGDSLNEMIRDRLVCGVEHDVIQTHLLAERDLTFEKALENAKTMDSILIGYSDADWWMTVTLLLVTCSSWQVELSAGPARSNQATLCQLQKLNTYL